MNALMLSTTRNRPGEATRPVWQFVALFFLIFTAYDLVQAGSCVEEVLGLPAGIFAAEEPGGGHGHTANLSDRSCPTQDSDQDEPGCEAEDCFCCCAHIREARVYFVAGMEFERAKHGCFPISVSSGPSEPPFHPPRTV